MRFSTVRNIVVHDPSTWIGRIFLTFDLDWCSDAVLAEVIDIVEKSGCAATWFVTHETTLLDRLRANPQFELGIHPNFNALLEGNFCYGRNPEEVIEFFMKIVPEAVSVRSHSMVQSSRIQGSFYRAGLRHDCNHFVPANAGIKLRPWRVWDCALTKVPHHWEDDVHCALGEEWMPTSYVVDDAINVFDFHPIHVALNSENVHRYEQSRNLHRESLAVLKQAMNRERPGTADFLRALIAMAS